MCAARVKMSWRTMSAVRQVTCFSRFFSGKIKALSYRYHRAKNISDQQHLWMPRCENWYKIRLPGSIFLKMSRIFLWNAQSKIFVGAFYASSSVSFQPTWPPRFLLRGGGGGLLKKQKRSCLKVHLAACRSVDPRGPAAEAAAAGEFLMAAQQRHSWPVAGAVGFCSAIRNTSQTRPNRDPYLSKRQRFRTRRPIISLLVSRFASPRCSLNPARQTHPSCQCRFGAFQNAIIDLDAQNKKGNSELPPAYWLWIKEPFFFK